MASYSPATSESPGSPSSSEGEGWQDDVAEDLDIFVRLSKAGHFKRAEEFFHAFLESHASEFAVAAQYAENLIEQGAFHSAEEFATAWILGNRDAEEEQSAIFVLLRCNARIYTRFDLQWAVSIAVSCLQKVDRLIIAEDMSPLKLQIVIISLRIMDLVSRSPLSQPSLFDENSPKLPFKLDRGSDQDPTCEEAIVALLSHGHIWEANTLFAIHLQYGRPTESDLLKIVHSVPKESDTMYDLVRFTMRVSCSRFLLQQSWEALMRSKVLGEIASSMRHSAMDGISDPVNSSRAYQQVKLLRLELRSRNVVLREFTQFDATPEVLWRTNDILEKARDNEDHILSLVSHEQFGYPLPLEWLQDTGAAREAIEYLYPHLKLSKDQDRKAAPESAKMDSGREPSSLQGERHGIKRAPIHDLGGTQPPPRKSIVGDSTEDAEARERLGVREMLSDNDSAYEVKTTQLPPDDCLKSLQHVRGKIELCERYSATTRLCRESIQYWRDWRRLGNDGEGLLNKVIGIRQHWLQVIVGDEDAVGVNKSTVAGLDQVFEPSFRQEAEEELSKVNIFDKGKPRKRDRSDEPEMIADIINGWNRVLELVAQCKALREDFDESIDRHVEYSVVESSRLYA